MKFIVIYKSIRNAINLLYEKDSLFLDKNYDINERTVTHRLAMYIESFIENSGYNVDVEYNRMRDTYNEIDDIGNLMGKRLSWPDDEHGSNFVYPDIVIHKRDQLDNLAIIEVKMGWKNDKKDFDLKKINEYIDQLNYCYGIYIELHQEREKCVVEFGPFELK